MTSKLTAFLKALNDQELCLFYYYRYTEFLPDSQLKIDDEIQRRNLQTSIMRKPEKLALIKENTSPQCKKCGSERFTTQVITEIKVGKFAQNENTYTEIKCSLCNKIN
jgi:hypothetical protein